MSAGMGSIKKNRKKPDQGVLGKLLKLNKTQYHRMQGDNHETSDTIRNRCFGDARSAERM